MSLVQEDKLILKRLEARIILTDAEDYISFREYHAVHLNSSDNKIQKKKAME